MEITNMKKVVVIIFLMLTIFSSGNSVFAAINESYQPTQGVMDDDIDTKVKDSVVIDALATFAYSIGSITENLVGKAFNGLTGNNIFPWADRILFNAIPMLDVNIFNPSEASLFKTKEGDVTPLAKIVRNTYFTILTLAVAFLTIVVGIAAVKLAISSIASEKAKYKEAIVKWMFSVVLIFLMHNAISFILWMNEQMVVVASSLLNESLLDANLALLNESLTIDNAKALENFLEANKSNVGLSDDEADYIKQNADIAYRLTNNGNYREAVLFDAFGDASHENRNWWKELFTGNGKQSIYALKADIEFIKTGKATYKKSEMGQATTPNGTGMTWVDKDITFDELIKSVENKSDDDIKNTSAYLFFNDHINEFTGGDGKHLEVSYYKKYVKSMTSVYNYIKGKEDGEAEKSSEMPDLMANLGLYFKEAAYTVPTDDDTGEMTGWHRSELTITGALLYAIFVFQSIFYFFAYLKRFFYIVILIIMAPIIVIIDFLRKALV